MPVESQLPLNPNLNWLIKKKKLNEKTKSERKRVDRMYVFKKWFYFVTIATTTIGKENLCI